MFKWILYGLAFIGFLWFVFIRNTPLSDFPKDSKGNIVIGEYSDSAEGNNEEFVDDEGSFVDETDQIEPNLEEELENTEEETSDVLDENKAFLIVVGSFGDKTNADKMLEKVMNDGHNGKIIYKDPLYRVIAASTDDLSDAKQLQDHFTHAYGVKAFVLKN